MKPSISYTTTQIIHVFTCISTCVFYDQYSNTLFCVAIPYEISSSICTNITYQSIILQWNPPSDNGGESVQYNITGTPDDISIITDNTMVDISNLTANTEYNFVVRANNSVGFGDELYIQCTTTLGNGNYTHTIHMLTFYYWLFHTVPNGFSNVQVSLGYNFSTNSTLLYMVFSVSLVTYIYTYALRS